MTKAIHTYIILGLILALDLYCDCEATNLDLIAAKCAWRFEEASSSAEYIPRPWPSTDINILDC